jgi:hypothetical protein
MKRIKISLVFALLVLGLTSRGQSATVPYDKALADSLGADERGMKMYTFVILKTGSKKITDKKVLDSLFIGHMANIKRLADMGKLIVAGPF